MPEELTPPDVDTSGTGSAPVSGDTLAAAPAYNQPSVGTRILGALSGGLHNTSYQVDPSTGQMGQVTDPNVRKPGDMLKSMLQGMLTGLAGGVQTNGAGHPGGLAAFAGGAQAAMDQKLQQNQQAQQTAQQDFQNSQKVKDSSYKEQEAKANFIKAQDEHAMSAFTLAREGTALQEHEAAQSNELAKIITTTPGAKHVAFAKDFGSLVDQLQDPKERQQIMEWRAKGELVQHPVVEPDANGNPRVVGVDFSHIPTEFLDKPTDKPVSYTENKVDAKTGKSAFVTHEIPAGQMSNRDAIAIQQKPMTGAITPEKQFEVDEENKRSDKQIAANKETRLSEFGQQRAMQAQRFADEEKLAKLKGEIVDPNNIDSLVDQFGTYHRDVKDFTRLDASSKGALGAALAQKYPGWNQSTYQASQTALNAAAKGQGTYAPLQSNDQGIQHLAALHKLLSNLPDTSNVQLINRTIQSVARQTGNASISSLDVLADAVASETANARSKTGHATDTEIRKARESLDLSKGTRALKAAVETLGKDIIPNTLESMAGELERQVPGIADRQYRPNVSKGAERALEYFKVANPFNYGRTPIPPAGTVKGGFSFVGGDPSKKENWKPVTQ